MVSPLSGPLWGEESVVLGAEEVLLGNGFTARVILFTIEIVELIARVTGLELTVCATGGSTAVQPAAVGVEVHWAKVGSTTLQPAVVGAEAHCASVGSTAVQPAAVGVEVHWANVGSTALQPAVVGAAVH